MMNALTHISEGVKTFLVLDFDGVLNQFPDAAESLGFSLDDRYLDFVTTVAQSHEGGRKYLLTSSTELLEGVNSLLADPTVQLVWLTTWRKGILPVQDTFLKFTPDRPAVVIDFSLKFSDYGNVHSKTEAFREFFDGVESGDSRLAWVDDDVVPSVLRRLAEEAEEARLAAESTSPTLDDLYNFDDEDYTLTTLLGRWNDEDRFLLGPAVVTGIRPSEFVTLAEFVRGGNGE